MLNFQKLSFSAILITSCEDENVSDNVVELVVEPTCTEGKVSPDQYIIVFKNSKTEPIDVIATSSSVTSTHLDGGYATLSGTSLTSPHVVGIMDARGSGPRTSGTVRSREENYPIAVR